MTLFDVRATLALALAAALATCGCSPNPYAENDDDQPAVDISQLANESVDYSMATPADPETLSSETAFRQFVAENEIAVVKFGAEWCPPCRKLDPEYEKIAGYFQKSNLAFGRVDVDEMSRLARELKIESIPDTFIYVGGNLYTRVSGYDPVAIANAVNSVCQEDSPTDDYKETHAADGSIKLEKELWGDESAQEKTNE